MRLSPLQDRTGATLLDLLAYFAALVIVINVCSTTFVRTNRLAAYTSAAILQQESLEAFSIEAVRAVHGASRVVPAAGGFTTGPEFVVLQNSAGYSVIGYTDGRLVCWTLVREGDAVRVDSVKSFGLPSGALAISFDTSDPASARSIAFHIVERPETDKKRGVARDIVAALRATGAAS